MKKNIALALSLSMVITLTACQNPASTTGTPPESKTSSAAAESTETAPVNVAQDESRKSTANSEERYEKIVIGLNADPSDLGPFNPNSPGKNMMWHEIYECLCDMDGDNYTPVLMKEYQVVDDLHYQVVIHDNINDSEGNHITADDVVFSYNWLVDSGYALKYDRFGGIEKIDDYTVEFTWNTPITDLGALEFIWCGTAIFSEKAFGDYNFSTEPVATGPYKVTSFNSGSSVVLKANDKYWQTDESQVPANHKRTVETIEFNVITEAAQQTIALETGKIDFSNASDINSIAKFQEGGEHADKYHTVSTVGNEFYFLAPNCSDDNLCADVNLRKAIFYAVSNDSCAQAVTSAKPIVTLGNSYYSDYVEKWESDENYMTVHDEDLAKEYLEKSSYQGEELTLLTINTELCTNAAQVIQAFLANVGINVKIASYDDNTVTTMMNDPEAWDIALLRSAAGGYQINADQLVMDNTIYSHGRTYNYILDDTLQQLFDTCSSIEGHTSENMDKLAQYWIENAYYCGILSPASITVITSDVAQICYDANGLVVPGGCTYYLD